jgi:hypothetical protein
MRVELLRNDTGHINEAVQFALLTHFMVVEVTHVRMGLNILREYEDCALLYLLPVSGA